MDQENKQNTNDEKINENMGVAPPPSNLPQGEPNISSSETSRLDEDIPSREEVGWKPEELEAVRPDIKPSTYKEAENSPTEEIVIPSLEEEKERGGPRSGKKLFFVGALMLVLFLVAGVAAYIFLGGGFGNGNTPKLEIPLIKEESGTEPIVGEAGTETPPQNQNQEEPPVETPQERDSRRKNDLNVLLSHLQRYAADSGGAYPVTEGLDRVSASHESVLIGYLIPRYAPSLLYDPQQNFFYGYRSDGATFQLSAVLESNEDPECVMEGAICIYRINEKGEIVTRK